MNARERVRAALRGRRPDRIPRYEIFLPGFVGRWRAERRPTPGVSIHDAYPRVDIGTVFATQVGPFRRRESVREEGEWTVRRDSWGRLVRERAGATFFEVLENPLGDKSALDALAFEDPADPARPDIAALAGAVKAAAGRFAPVSGVMGLFMPAYYLRGETAFMTDLLDDAPFCRALIGRVADYVSAQAEAVVRATETADTALWIYDDFGSSRGPLISPALFEEFFAPVYRRMIERVRALGVESVILHHDGNCWAVLDLLVAAGFTGIQGVYPGAGMSVPAVKAKYGSRLCVVGGVCNATVLRAGSRAEIERHVAGIVEAGRDGGVIIGSHSVDDDVSPAQYDVYSGCVDRHDAAWAASGAGR